MIDQDFSYPKSLRLLHASDFKLVFDQPDSKASSREFLLLARSNQTTQPRLGLVVGKKSVRKAAGRNLIKRVMREQFRLNQHVLQGFDFVLLARRGADQLDAIQLHAQFSQLLQQIVRRLSRRPAEGKPADA